MYTLDKGQIVQAVDALARAQSRNDTLRAAHMLGAELANDLSLLAESKTQGFADTELAAAYAQAIQAMVVNRVSAYSDYVNELYAQYEEEEAGLFESAGDARLTTGGWDLAIAFYTGYLFLGGK